MIAPWLASYSPGTFLIRLLYTHIPSIIIATPQPFSFFITHPLSSNGVLSS